MAGESVDALEVDARGAVGDRAVAVRTETGKIASGKNTRRFERVDRLLECRASMRADGTVEVALPGASAAALDAAALGRALGRSLEYAREDAESHFDAAGLHLISSATLAWLVRESGAVADVRRVRANVVIDLDDEPHGEEQWVGKEMVLGAVRVRITEPTERCVMTTLAQRALPAAPEVLRTIATRAGACLGVYAEVVTPGVVRVGDPVTPWPGTCG